MSLALFGNCAARFVSDLVVNPEDKFSRVTALMVIDNGASSKENLSELSNQVKLKQVCSVLISKITSPWAQADLNFQ